MLTDIQNKNDKIYEKINIVIQPGMLYWASVEFRRYGDDENWEFADSPDRGHLSVEWHVSVIFGYCL